MIVEPLRVRDHQKRELHDRLKSDVRRALDLPSNEVLEFVTNSAERSVVIDYHLASAAHPRTVLDLRGYARDVVLIQDSGRSFVYLGHKLSWAKERNHWRFVGSQIVIFLGASNDADAPTRQLLRLEWEGVRKEGNFEAPQAAHPHWQVDIGQRFIASELTLPTDRQIFPAAPSRHDEPAPRWLSRLHLAAAAKWAVQDWDGSDSSPAHAAGPTQVEDLARWTISACRYLNSQISSAISGM